jgi:phosphatidylglycerophosphatase C
VEVLISQQFTVAAFDFDNTLTICDTLLPFLKHLAGTPSAFQRLFPLVPAFCLYGIGWTSRQEIKELILEKFISQKSFKEVSKQGEFYAEKLLPRYLRKQGIERLQWHLNQGHRCVLVSAAIDLYLKPWGEKAGFHDIICSKCLVDDAGFLTGKLEMKNCWGDEKANRLQSLLGPRENYTLYAYGDSRGDKELLELADFPFFRSFG